MTTEPTTPHELVQWILAPHRAIGSNDEFVRRIEDYAKRINGDFITNGLDHQGPIDGYCFLGLNFTPEQYQKIAQPIINHGALGSLEFCTEEAIVSLIESAGSYDHRLFVKAKQFIEEVLGRPLNPTEETRSAGIEES